MKIRVKNTILAAILAFTTLFTAGCGISVTGTEAAKRILANERLESGVFSKSGNIFDKGTAAMNQLVERATANLNIPVEKEAPSEVMAVSSAVASAKVLKGDYKGRLEIDGDTFRFKDFEEDNNSYNYFENLTGNIVSRAKMAAELIDDVKSNVRVVDKWIKMPFGSNLLLHVEADSETLCRYTASYGGVEVCKRYKNSEGKDVYEMYMRQRDIEHRMTYIPGERYELSMLSNDSGDYFVADNSKGYWETYIVGAMETHYNVSYFIMKDGVCYDCFYHPEAEQRGMIKVMSADRATDMFNFNERGSGEFSSYDISIKFSGFDGIDYVEAKGDAVSYNESEGYANLGGGGAKLVLDNGNVVNEGDVYADGKLTVGRVLVMFGADGYTGELELTISGLDHAEMVSTLVSYINHVGLRCRRPINDVVAGIKNAQIDAQNIIKYYKWNGVLVTTEEKIAEAIDIEKARFEEMNSYYEAVKDIEVIDYLDTISIKKNIKFASIVNSATSAEMSGNLVTVSSASLTINDTTLYVEGDEYKVAVALLPVGGDGLIHVEYNGNGATKYGGESDFTVKTDNITFTLPDVEAGEYKVVAYIATSEDIRISKYEEVKFDSVNADGLKIGVKTVKAEKDSNGALTLNYEATSDSYFTVSSDEPMGYEEFYELIATEAFTHGIPDSIIEQLTDDGYGALAEDVSEIAGGKYRIAYKSENGTSETSGYLYVDYTFE